jgi:hypothetical protein
MASIQGRNVQRPSARAADERDHRTETDFAPGACTGYTTRTARDGPWDAERKAARWLGIPRSTLRRLRATQTAAQSR